MATIAVEFSPNVLSRFERALNELSFFFQAEDGIRDTSVTGVQTCALPILPGISNGIDEAPSMPFEIPGMSAQVFDLKRSEERRVGKECRSRWWREQEKKKKKQSNVVRKATKAPQKDKSTCAALDDADGQGR